MLETSLLSIRIKVLIFYVIYLFVFVLWHYTQQEDFFDHYTIEKIISRSVIRMTKAAGNVSFPPSHHLMDTKG